MYFDLQLVLLILYFIPCGCDYCIFVDLCEMCLYVYLLPQLLYSDHDIHTYSQTFDGNFAQCGNTTFNIHSSLHVVTLVASLYCFIWINQKCNYAYKNRFKSSKKPVENGSVEMVKDDNGGVLADRIMHPNNYKERYVQNNPKL